MINGPQGTTNPAEGSAPAEVKPFDLQARLKEHLTRNEKPTPGPDSEEENVDDELTGEVGDEDQEQPELPEDESDDELEDNEKTGLPPEFYAKTVKAVVNGEELEITVDEATKGYQRLQDYTRKSQEVARSREELNGTLEEYKQGITVIAQFLQADIEAFNKINWDELKAADPNQYAVKKLEAQDARQKMSLLQQSWKEAATRQAAMQADNLKEAVATESVKLAKALPDWNDPVKGPPFKTAVMKYANEIGFTQAEVMQVIDHRYLVVLNEARMYRELMKKQGKLKDKLVVTPGKNVKTGERVAPSRQDAIQKADARLIAKQDMRSAADALKARWASNK